MIICNVVIPQLFWFKKLRTHVPTLFVISTFINIGMWFERYVIIITSACRASTIPAVWGLYTPTWAELIILAGSFGFFAMLFLIFIKIFPVIAISEVKELAIHERAHAHGHGGSALMPSLVGIFDAARPGRGGGAAPARAAASRSSRSTRRRRSPSSTTRSTRSRAACASTRWSAACSA